MTLHCPTPQMTRVPFEERTAAMHSTVGYLAIQEGQPVSVIVRAFQSVLRLNPYAVEAMDVLARYRPSDSEVCVAVCAAVWLCVCVCVCVCVWLCL